VTYDLNTPAIGRLWPYEPDWKGGFSVTRSFLTDIVTSRRGREQRRALRDVPRLRLSYNSVLTGAQLRGAEQFLRAAQNRPVMVPDFARYGRLTGASSGGATTLTLASPPAWVAPNSHLVLCGGVVREMVLVESVAGSTITLTEPLANAWANGSVVRPGIFGLLRPQLRETRFKPGASGIEVQLDAYPGGEPVEDEGAAGTLFNGLEVLATEPDWSGAPSHEWLWPVEQVDYGVGRTAQFRPIDRTQGLLEAQFVGLTAAGALAFEQHFLRHKGMRGAFYRSTCNPDMVLNANVTGTTFVVQGSAIADDFAATDFGAIEQAIEIVQTNGTRLRRLVTDIAASGGNTAITVNSSVTLTVAGTARISWLPKVRFASDELTTDWLTPNLARIGATFQTIDE
jgi:hypothetical protein